MALEGLLLQFPFLSLAALLLAAAATLGLAVTLAHTSKVDVDDVPVTLLLPQAPVLLLSCWTKLE